MFSKMVLFLWPTTRWIRASKRGVVLHIASDLRSEMDDSEHRAAIRSASPGTEVHHYRFWYGEPTSQEVISLNGIHAGIVTGSEHAATGIDSTLNVCGSS